MVGVVAAVRERMNKEKGTRFGFLTLEDLTGTVEVVCWAARPANGQRPAQKGWTDWELFCKSDEPLLVHGEVRINNREEENPRAEITAIDIEPLSVVRKHKPPTSTTHPHPHPPLSTFRLTPVTRKTLLTMKKHKIPSAYVSTHPSTSPRATTLSACQIHHQQSMP